ncbi:UNVERIFIED_CONTAM: hypothetical protein Scaly_2227200 [Sesamum calycinum]|uniref:Uncharacterized protein n=1 Tax=Sesamum calycinum TaxID=2727403 RepID=A0AAW2M9U5_9LAMI
MIKDVGYRNEMDVSKLVDYPGENDECSMVQSLEEIVVDIIENPTNDEAEDDSILLELVTRKEALSAATTLHNFLLQLENSTSEHVAAIKKVRDEIQLDLNFKKKSSTRAATCSRIAAKTICCIAPNKAGDNSSVEVSEEVLRRRDQLWC